MGRLKEIGLIVVIVLGVFLAGFLLFEWLRPPYQLNDRLTRQKTTLNQQNLKGLVERYNLKDKSISKIQINLLSEVWLQDMKYGLQISNATQARVAGYDYSQKGSTLVISLSLAESYAPDPDRKVSAANMLLNLALNQISSGDFSKTTQADILNKYVETISRDQSQLVIFTRP